MKRARFIGSVNRLRLRPGDAIVLSTEELITDETAKRLREQVEAHFPGHRCLVLGPGMKLGVLSS
jgi:hypothetical protein